jgi:hypothetical protein
MNSKAGKTGGGKGTPADGAKGDQVQGEGNYEAGRRYDEAQKRFVDSGQVEKAAGNAAPKDQAEAEAMRRAEEKGKSHAKDEDPDIERP